VSLDTQILKQLDKTAQEAGAAKTTNERYDHVRNGYAIISYYADKLDMNDHLAAAYINKFEFLLAQYRRK
jgi:hypothetical protein